MAELNFGLLNPPGSQSIGNAFVQGMDQAAAARAQENQNALSQYTLGKARREDELSTQLLGELRKATTPEEIYRAYQRVGKPDVALKMQTDALTQDELRGKIKLQPVALAAAKSKLVDDKLAQSRQYLDNINPDNPSAAQQYLAWHEANHNDLVLGPELAARGVTVEQSRARIDAALQQPGGLQRLINESKVGVAKFAEMNKPSNVQRNTGNTVETLSIPGMGGAATVVPGSQATIKVSPNTAATIDAARRNHLENLAQQGWTFDTERGIGVNARLGLSKPISTLMSQTGGPLAAPVGGGGAGGAPAVQSGVPMVVPTGVPGQRQAPVGQAPAGQPVAGPSVLEPKPEKPSTEYLKEAKGIINTNYAINNLKQLTNNFTAADMLNPTRRAEIEAAHSTAVLLAKDMFGLGVLNEGDERILRKIIPDPTAFSKGLVPIETIRKNLVLATNVINRMNETSAKVHKQPLLQLDSMTPSAPSPSAPPIQSFRPSPERRP